MERKQERGVIFALSLKTLDLMQLNLKVGILCIFKVEEAMSKNKKKKLKKKRKKQRELLEQQLSQMEGLAVDVQSLNGVLSSPTSLNSFPGDRLRVIFLIIPSVSLFVAYLLFHFFTYLQ